MIDPSKLDPYGGFLCLSSHWQPNPNDPDPYTPGQKLVMSSYIPTRPGDICLCGSGRTYKACCQPKRYWYPICLNPDVRGYSLLAVQSAIFYHVDGSVIRKQLTGDARLHCVDDSIKSSFWLLWGDPALEDQYGILCFGDIELKQNHTLLVTALSDLRMQILLEMLEEITDKLLEKPSVTYEKPPLIDKQGYRKTQKK
jgi:hypothetical protein